MYRYYNYISDGKVDMILPQIPGEEKEKICLEFKIDLKVISAGWGNERVTLDDQISRLVAVENYIRKTEKIGTIESPESWFEGNIDAYIWYSPDMAGGPLKDSVYFLGDYKSSKVLLGGSLKHMSGNVNNEPLQVRKSELANIYHTIGRLLIEHNETDNIPDWYTKLYGQKEQHENKAWYERAKQLGLVDTDRVLYDFLDERTDDMKFPKQKIHFLAKKFHITPDEHGRVVIGSPLFVSLDT